MILRPELKAWWVGSLPTWIIAIGLMLGIVMEFRHGLFCRMEAREMQSQLVHVIRMQGIIRTDISSELPPLPQGGSTGGNWQDELKKLRMELRTNGILK